MVVSDLFVCLSWGFTAQSIQWGHVKHGQFTYPHFQWAGLVLLAVDQYCAHSFARNWQLPFLNQWNGENDRRNYFLIKSSQKNVTDRVGSNPQPPDHQSDAHQTEPPRFGVLYLSTAGMIRNCFFGYLMIFSDTLFRHTWDYLELISAFVMNGILLLYLNISGIIWYFFESA